MSGGWICHEEIDTVLGFSSLLFLSPDRAHFGRGTTLPELGVSGSVADHR